MVHPEKEVHREVEAKHEDSGPLCKGFRVYKVMQQRTPKHNSMQTHTFS